MTETNPGLTLKLGVNDNVALCLADIIEGQALGHQLIARQDVTSGHKLALVDIDQGQAILKYNQVIGVASRPIAAGSHVHIHNVDMPPSNQQNSKTQTTQVRDPINARVNAYRRQNGAVGTRNFIGIITTVNCSASVARAIANQFPDSTFDGVDDIDGVVVLTHTSGCGMAASGEGPETLYRTLAGYVNHPNFAAVLVIGLGCEVAQLSTLLDMAGRQESERLRVLGIQQSGGTRRSVEQGRAIIERFIALVLHDRRQPEPASNLILGLQCGGSDGWSGVTANPALGRAADYVVAAGGTVVLSETPEIYGAEQLLFARAQDQQVVDALQARLDWWQAYLAKNNAELNNNPSPGNIQGGITTIIEKSLGAVAKSGQSELVAIYPYAEQITHKGFVFMDSPGYDPCSATGQMASGANLLAFTTGRGSVFGSKPAPCIKLSSNAALARDLDEDIDIDCSDILGDTTLEQKGEEIFQILLDTASGKRSKSELFGLGDLEFVPWQIGAVV